MRKPERDAAEGCPCAAVLRAGLVGEMQSRTVRRLGVVALSFLGAIASVASCVGDDAGAGGPTTPAATEADAAADTRTASETGTDGGVTDASTDGDGSLPGCDPAKPFGAAQQVSSLDTAQSEQSVWFSPDEKTVFLTSIRPDAGGGASFDIFSGSRAQLADPFGVLTLTANINSTANDEYPVLTADGLTLYLGSTRAGGLGSDDIYVATRGSTAADFGALSLVTNLNTSSHESPTWLSADGNTLYLQSDRVAPFGIYRSLRVGGTFQTPVAVAELNSASGEANAILSSDQLVVYFGSLRAGTGTSGQTDIWMATRTTPAGTFTSPTPLTTINSSADDWPLWVSPDNCRLYLGSDRPGSGSRDIWMAQR
jgi:hypothetical protein